MSDLSDKSDICANHGKYMVRLKDLQRGITPCWVGIPKWSLVLRERLRNWFEAYVTTLFN